MNNPIMKNEPNKLIVIFGMISPFIGIFAAIYGIDRIENYNHPYLFSLICGTIGFGFGWLFSIRIKPYTRFNDKQLKEYSKAILFFSSGFVGLMIAIGSHVNSGLSTEVANDYYVVTNKTYKEYRFASPSANWLHLTINGKTERLRCKSDYWNKIRHGQSINISTYKSKIGFDYYILTNE
ncbi:MAG: hypothetical protein DRJ01_12075 [Bacteroidetes bacterium]|nr:MAG: hypothetical protein DRJ01_12075 [Bacteroidota bacterium]